MQAKWIVPVALAIACQPKSPDAAEESSSASTDGSTSDTGGGGMDGDLQVCHELPAAEIAQWVEGEPIAPSGESTPERMESAGTQTWEVALDLLRVTDPGQYPSVASSPTSMAIALGLSYGRWSEGECGQRIHTVMHYVEDGDALHDTLGASILELESRELPATDEEDPVVVGLRPSVWSIGGGVGVPSLLTEFYGATQHGVSTGNMGALEAIREVMNCVIEQQSAGLLVDFVPQGNPKSDTTSYDVNVAYLQAPWAVALARGVTLAFTRDDGAVEQIDAIFGSDVISSFFETDELIAFEMPLRGEALAVSMVMPKAGAFANLKEFTDGVTADDLAVLRASATPVAATLTMPIVDIPSVTIDYNPLLGFACPPFTLRDVFHGAAVQMDEKGIKAAAATVAEGWATGGTGPGEPPVVVTLDRPFAFFVYDRVTQFVLYSGRFAGA